MPAIEVEYNIGIGFPEPKKLGKTKKTTLKGALSAHKDQGATITIGIHCSNYKENKCIHFAHPKGCKT